MLRARLRVGLFFVHSKKREQPTSSPLTRPRRKELPERSLLEASNLARRSEIGLPLTLVKLARPQKRYTFHRRPVDGTGVALPPRELRQNDVDRQRGFAANRDYWFLPRHHAAESTSKAVGASLIWVNEMSDIGGCLAPLSCLLVNILDPHKP